MASYNVASSIIYGIKKQKGQLWSFMATSESVEVLQVMDTEKAKINPRIATVIKKLPART